MTRIVQNRTTNLLIRISHFQIACLYLPKLYMWMRKPCMSLSKASQHLKERLKNPNVYGVAIKYIPTIKRLQIVKRSVFFLRYPNNLFLLLGNADIYWEEYCTWMCGNMKCFSSVMNLLFPSIHVLVCLLYKKNTPQK